MSFLRWAFYIVLLCPWVIFLPCETLFCDSASINRIISHIDNFTYDHAGVSPYILSRSLHHLTLSMNQSSLLQLTTQN